MVSNRWIEGWRGGGKSTTRELFEGGAEAEPGGKRGVRGVACGDAEEGKHSDTPKIFSEAVYADLIPLRSLSSEALQLMGRRGTTALARVSRIEENARRPITPQRHPAQQDRPARLVVKRTDAPN